MAENTFVMELPPQSTYGAVELKEIIRKYTLRGFLYALGVILLLLVGYFVLTKATEEKKVKKIAPPISKIQLTTPPPDATEEQQAVTEAPPPDVDLATIAKAGNPVPIPDAEVTELKDYAGFDQLSESLSNETGTTVDLSQMPSDFNLDAPKQVEVKQEEAIPDMDEFVSYEVDPVYDLGDIQSKVVYPEVAIRAGIEGKVEVSVYIDKSGKVAKYQVRRSSSSMLDKAAVEAIKKSTFKPAIQNKQPVGSWLLIPVTFKLR